MTKSAVSVASAIFLISFIPPLVFVGAGQSSYAAGIAVAFSLFVPIAAYSERHSTVSLTAVLTPVSCAVVLGILIVIQALAASFENREFDFSRALSSYVLLIAETLMSLIVAWAIWRARSLEISSITYGLLALFLISALFSVAGTVPGPWMSRDKPVVPFSEPSHFALGISCPLIVAFTIARRGAFWLLLFCVLLIVVCVKSLTLVTVLVMCILCRLNARIAFGISIVAGIIGAVQPDLSYYTDRLDLSSSSSNLSALVWLQGWQEAFQGLVSTNGWGVGFQQFGLHSVLADIAERIKSVSGEYPNLLDGGTMAAKLCGEFGILGIVVVLIITTFALHCVVQLRRYSKCDNPDARRVFACAGLVSYTVEMFIRSIGYFSPGTFFLFVSIALIWLSKRKTAGVYPSMLSKGECFT